MEVKVATACLHWSQPSVPHSPSSHQTLASTFSSPSLRRRRSFSDGALVFRSSLFGTNLRRSRSCDNPKASRRTIRRACSDSLDAFSDEDFSRKIQELAMRFQSSDDNEESSNEIVESEIVAGSVDGESYNNVSVNLEENQRPFDPVEPPDWLAKEEIIPASVEWRAKSVDLPVSLRIIKKKKKWQQGVIQVGESAYCSMKKAFSSMVFIIRELHSFSLQMREKLLYEDLQEILVRVQQEMHASFVWLFQQVFSPTPTLMVYVMILLANYSVYSMSAAAAPPPPQPYAAMTESVSASEVRTNKQQKLDPRSIKSFSVSSSGGKAAAIGGNNGGGGKSRPVASGSDGEGRFDGSTSMNFHRATGNPVTREEESVSGQEAREEEMKLWNSIVEEARRMQAVLRDESLDHESVRRFISPVTAKIEAEDYADYMRTEISYQMGLAQEPNNPLLLANYAQFLYLVAHDCERAEEYFKRAAKVEPPDAEALNKYASFLWLVKKDLWAAEETYLEAIAADPSNSFYAANYAHFLWNTGGEDTCFPLDTNTNTNNA